MDAPVWSNDLLYLNEMFLTIAITIGITAICFYISKRSDKRRAARLAKLEPAAEAQFATEASGDQATD